MDLCLETRQNRSVILNRRLDPRGFYLFIIGLSVIALDQYTKHLVRRYIPLYTSWNPISWLNPIVTLTHVKNTGAAFGLFKDMSIVFIVIALVVIVAIIAYYRQLAQASWILRLALGLQLGGAAGNLIDRLHQQGCVTDFIDFRVWPVFNVADASVVIGTALLAYYALFVDVHRDEEETDNPKELEIDTKVTGES